MIKRAKAICCVLIGISSWCAAMHRTAFIQDCDQAISTLDVAESKLATAVSALIAGDTPLSSLCEIESSVSVLNSKLSQPIDCSSSGLDEIESELETAESIIDGWCSQVDSLIDGLNDAKSCLGTEISQEDVGTAGFTINSSGYYFIKSGGITFTPSSSNTAAITISVDDVYLDLNGQAITISGGASGSHGVEIATTRDNVQIHNGFIKNADSDAIAVGATSSNITLGQLIISGSGGGIMFDTPATNVLIEDVLAKNNSGDGVAFTSGSANSNIIMRNIFSVGNTGATTVGFDMAQTVNVTMENCFAFGNGDHGFSINTSASRVFCQECVSLQNTDEGFFISDAQNNLINHCEALGNNRGVSFDGNSDFNHVINSFFADNDIGVRINDGNTDGVYIADNCAQFNNSFNMSEATGGTNSIVGNYAYDDTGNNYTGPSMNKNIIALRVSSFLDVPTRWYNIDMRNS